jgi:predicted nucleic acid-binding protein
MAFYLLDTNVSLRFLDSTDSAHPLAIGAVAGLLSRGDQPVIAPQVLVELWAVATRPKANNGLGWDLKRVQTGLQDLTARFQLLEETRQIFPAWLRLVTVCGVQGKQVHDARLAANVLAHGHQHIVTFNAGDFGRYPGIIPVHPNALLPTIP